MENYDTYDFLVTDEDEVMLIIYTRDGDPVSPTITLDVTNHKMVLKRNDADIITLENIDNKIFDDLMEETSLLVCEIEPTDNEDEHEIVYTYEADIID